MKTIIINNVSKKFRMGYNKKQNKFSKILSFLSGKESEKDFWALKNISFSVKSGEKIGIIGDNGAGKTTLLRVIAKIYKSDTGNVKIFGKIISLGPSLGLLEKLSMKDNIFLFCSFYGLKKKEIKQKFKTIVNYAELETYENTKIYQFSDGMRVKLMLSIVIHCNPDILLYDDTDIFTDKKFSKKSIMRNIELSKKGKSILIASHNLNTLKYCDRIIWIDKGKILSDGKPKIILKKYIDYIDNIKNKKNKII